jgi:hypothetical protein
MKQQSPSNSALVTDACAAALRAFYNAPQRERQISYETPCDFRCCSGDTRLDGLRRVLARIPARLELGTSS